MIVEYLPIALSIFVAALAIAGLLYFAFRKTQKLEIEPRTFDKVTKIDDFEVFYQDSGQGSPLVFLHGIGASSHTWRYQLKDLSKRHRVIVPDLPGFGRSSKLTEKSYRREDQVFRVAKLLQSIDVKHCTLVGSSLGGVLAISLSVDYPELVSKLVLLAPATEPSLVPKGVYNISWTSGLLHTFVNRPLIKTIIKRVNANMDNISEDDVDIYYEPYKDKDAIKTFIKSLKTLRDRQIEKVVELVKVPTLILYGQKDNMVPLWAMEKLNKKIPHSSLSIHKNAGHHLQEDDFDWTNQQIIQFLD